MAVRQHFVFHLNIANGISQLEVEVPFKVPNRIAELRQFSLQSDPLIARELVVVGRPTGLDWRKPANSIREMRRCQRVDIGVVVALDHVEVRGNQKGGSGGPRREDLQCPPHLLEIPGYRDGEVQAAAIARTRHNSTIIKSLRNDYLERRA